MWLGRCIGGKFPAKGKAEVAGDGEKELEEVADENPVEVAEGENVPCPVFIDGRVARRFRVGSNGGALLDKVDDVAELVDRDRDDDVVCEKPGLLPCESPELVECENPGGPACDSEELEECTIPGGWPRPGG